MLFPLSISAHRASTRIKHQQHWRLATCMFSLKQHKSHEVRVWSLNTLLVTSLAFVRFMRSLFFIHCDYFMVSLRFGLQWKLKLNNKKKRKDEFTHSNIICNVYEVYLQANSDIANCLFICFILLAGQTNCFCCCIVFFSDTSKTYTIDTKKNKYTVSILRNSKKWLLLLFFIRFFLCICLDPVNY